MTTVLHPKGNRITVLRDAEKKTTEGGIEIPDNVKPTDHCIGTVLELGPGVLRWQAEHAGEEIKAILAGTDLPASLRPIKPGDRVLYTRYAGIDMVVGGQSICVLMHHPDHDEIIGVLEGEGE